MSEEERSEELEIFEMGSVSEETKGFPGGDFEGAQPLPEG